MLKNHFNTLLKIAREECAYTLKAAAHRLADGEHPDPVIAAQIKAERELDAKELWTYEIWDEEILDAELTRRPKPFDLEQSVEDYFRYWFS